MSTITSPIPLPLTDAQFAQVVRCAAPLPPTDRDQYLRRVAALLNECGEIGDGVVGRIAAQAQRELFTAPRSPGSAAPRFGRLQR